MGKPPSDALKWGNVPVPFTAMWSDEADRRRPFIRLTRIGWQDLWMLCEGINQPSGKPLFKIQHADRMRYVVMRKLCQMCVRPMPRIVVGFNQGQTDAFRPLLNDGLPMCPACAADAFRACPGMQEQARQGVLRIWQTERGKWLLAPVVLGIVPSDQGGHEEINDLIQGNREPIFTGPKIVLTDWRRMTVEELLQCQA